MYVCVYCHLSLVQSVVLNFLVLERHYILKTYWNLKELLFMWIVSIFSAEIKTDNFFQY